MDDNIVRYVLVDDGFGNRSWYIDETDSVEERDFVLVPYGIDEKRGFAATVVRCIPHTHHIRWQKQSPFLKLPNGGESLKHYNPNISFTIRSDPLTRPVRTSILNTICPIY